jgi:hypothetical protein
MRRTVAAVCAALATLFLAASIGSALPSHDADTDADSLLRSHLDARIQLHLIKLRVRTLELAHLP